MTLKAEGEAATAARWGTPSVVLAAVAARARRIAATVVQEAGGVELVELERQVVV